MSATIPTLTRCARAGCEAMTRNTFCGVECRRLASIGPGTRARPLRGTCGHGTATAMTEDADRSTGVSRAEYRHMALYTARHDPRDCAGTRRVANARRRREVAEKRREKRRAALRKRR